MLLYFKTKTCIQIEHSNIKLIFITYLSVNMLFVNAHSEVIPVCASDFGVCRVRFVIKKGMFAAAAYLAGSCRRMMFFRNGPLQASRSVSARRKVLAAFFSFAGFGMNTLDAAAGRTVLSGEMMGLRLWLCSMPGKSYSSMGDTPSRVRTKCWRWQLVKLPAASHAVATNWLDAH